MDYTPFFAHRLPDDDSLKPRNYGHLFWGELIHGNAGESHGKNGGSHGKSLKIEERESMDSMEIY